MPNKIVERYCKSCNSSKNIGDEEEAFTYKKNLPNLMEGFQTNAYRKLIVNPNEVKTQRFKGGKHIVNPDNMDDMNTQRFKASNTFWNVGVL